METKITDVSRAIRRKGLLEVLVVVGNHVICRMYGLIRISLLNIRGYRIDYRAMVAPSSDFFQGSYHAISVGAGSEIRRNTRMSAGFDGKITIGRNVLIDEGSHVMAQQSISIGDNTLIAPYCFITDFNHRFDSRNKTVVSQGYMRENVVIKEDVWIGAHCIILPGVTIAKGSIVGAGSVVTRNVAPYTIVAGNPAKIIGHRP